MYTSRERGNPFSEQPAEGALFRRCLVVYEETCLTGIRRSSLGGTKRKERHAYERYTNCLKDTLSQFSALLGFWGDTL